jgi:hypothetical protein
MKQIPIMRSIGFIALVGLVVVSCTNNSPTSPSANNPFSGTWVGPVVGQLAGTSRLTLAQDGTALTGTWNVTYSNPSLNGSGTATGSANGDAITLTLQPSVPTQCPIAVTATVSGSRMIGTAVSFNCTLSSSGSIDLTKQ